MNRDRIISSLFTGKNFNDCLAKMEPASLRDDLRQEVIVVICEMPEDKLLRLWADGALEFYTVRVMLNMTRNTKWHPFARKFKTTFVELTNKEIADICDLEERRCREQAEDRALAEVDNLYWYNAALVRMYQQLGTYRAIEDATRIPWESAYLTIKNSFKTIKEKVA